MGEVSFDDEYEIGVAANVVEMCGSGVGIGEKIDLIVEINTKRLTSLETLQLDTVD